MLRDTYMGNSFSVSLKKVWAISMTAQNFFQCKPCLFAEVSNRSHAGKAIAKLKTLIYNYNLSKFPATYRSISPELWPIVLILIFSLVADIISVVIIHHGLNSLLIGNIFLLIQFSLLAYLFKKQSYFIKTSLIVYVFFVIFFTFNIIFYEGPWKLNSASNVLASIILITFSMYYLYRLLHDLPVLHIHKLPMLWICFAILVYYGGNFFLFLAGNYLSETPAFQRSVWILHNLLNVIKNLLFAIALWQNYRNVKSSLSS
ncbi:MAG: hypothetical protein HRU69_12420 [Flammeovirgaceae bacterium]|nr:MAG: hypothetical protein HRU69_12420 [Flammeovirgaceae bacterium]